jgi:HEAT repeat protein
MPKPPKPSSVEAALDRLAALRADPSGAGVPDEIACGLAHRSEIVVAKAVQLTGEFRLRQLKPQLIQTFTRFLHPEPKAPDRGCEIKKGIAAILLDLELNDPDVVEGVYLPGLRVSQVDWGDDAAAQLRGTCALGLVAGRHRGVMVLLTDLLTDRWPGARAGAARALGNTGEESAALLLRLKLRLTNADPDSDVAAECMNALVRLLPAQSLEFIASFLDNRSEATRSAAALALGASRQPEAFEPLRARLERTRDPDTRQVLLLALATLRLPEAVDRVLAAAESRDAATAIAAIEALGLYRHDPAVRDKLQTAVAGGEEEVKRAFAKVFR